jgi:hypothetical protein
MHDQAAQSFDALQARDIEQWLLSARTDQKQADLHGHAASQEAAARASR